MRKKVWIGLWIFALALGIALGIWKLSFQQLAAPHYLWGMGLLVPAALYLHRRHHQQKQRLAQLYDSHLHTRLFSAPPTAPLWQYLGLFGMICCVIVALARPQGPLIFSEGSTTGIDILIGIDVSDSMKALDEGYPNRMGAAASVVKQLTPALDGDRVGLFVFSGEAFSLAPFTYDHSTLHSFVEEVRADLLPSATTDLEEALKHALHRFQVKSDQKPTAQDSPEAHAGQLLLLFSDGENQLGDYRDELETLARYHIPVITVGVGTKEGARIPMDSLMGRSYKVWQGNYAITKLDAKTLQTLADTTQGRYLPLAKINQLPGVLNAMRQHLQSRRQDTQTQQFEERYPYWLVFGLLLWGLWPTLLSQLQRRSRKPKRSFEQFTTVLKRTLKKQPHPLAVAIILSLLSPFLQSAWSWNPLGWQPFWRNNQGQEAYENKNYERAEEAFQKGLAQDPNNTALRNNEAHAQYRNKRYDQAIENYKQNLENPQLTPEQQANTFYNLGNSYYRKGQASPDMQEQQWKEALSAYQEALKRNPQDEQALENLNFVQQQLNQQKQQQQQNKGQNAQPQQNQQSPAAGDQPDQQPSSPPQNQGNAQQDPGRAPDQAPTPEPSPQYFDQEKVDQFLKQQEQQEEQSKGGFHRTRQNAQGNPNRKGDPWSNTVKDW